ncbi:hypothetical protein GGI43DRAFT_51341 [Trichoderma evansii]
MAEDWSTGALAGTWIWQDMGLTRHGWVWILTSLKLAGSISERIPARPSEPALSTRQELDTWMGYGNAAYHDVAYSFCPRYQVAACSNTSLHLHKNGFSFVNVSLAKTNATSRLSQPSSCYPSCSSSSSSSQTKADAHICSTTDIANSHKTFAGNRSKMHQPFFHIGLRYRALSLVGCDRNNLQHAVCMKKHLARPLIFQWRRRARPPESTLLARHIQGSNHRLRRPSTRPKPC